MADLSNDERVILRNLQTAPLPPQRHSPVDNRRPRAQASTPLGREFLRRVPGLSADIADLHAQAWVRRYFDVSDATAWLDAGLATDEWELAYHFRFVGITPLEARIVIRRETMIDRIRRGTAAWRIAEMLEREGHLKMLANK